MSGELPAGLVPSMGVGVRVFIRLAFKTYVSVIQARVISFDDAKVCVYSKGRGRPTKHAIRFYKRADVFTSRHEAMAGDLPVRDRTDE
jgi:hypothetical protein